MAGYFKCKACQKSYLRATSVKARESFCSRVILLGNPLRFWRAVRFTDKVHFCLDSRSTEWVIRIRGERFCKDYIQFNKRNHTLVLHVWAMVGYDYKSELIFFDINDQIEEDPLWVLEITEQEGLLLPVLALEITEEEQRLIGESNYKHNCKDKTACKHECYKGYKSKKKGGNMTQT